MRKGIFYVVIFLVLLVGPTAVRYLDFYQLGGTERQEPPDYAGAEIEQVSIPAASDFVDEPEVGDGFVLLDQAHDNFFTLEEIGYLDGRLAARGYELRSFEFGDLTAALRSVKAFVVIAPQSEFAPDEVTAVRDFVARGGRLLLIGDPTRFSVFFEEDLFTFSVDIVSDKLPLNSLANEFDIIFNADYLYNTSDNEGNFRNIILHDGGLGESDFTDGLNQLVFYGSHSLQVGPNGRSILMGDDNTWSSDTDRPGGLTLAASSENGRVLALGDIHFLTPPYYTVNDNSQFIARIADFLTDEAERTYTLADFPYFYDDEVNLVYVGSPDLGPDVFDEIIVLQDAFRAADINLSVKAAADGSTDTLYLGLYNQADDVIDLLVSNGISLTIQPPILTEEEMQALADAESDADVEEEEVTAEAEETEETEAEATPEAEADEGEEEAEEVIRLIRSDLGNVQMSGTAVILMQQDGDQHNIIVLAASQEGLENTIDRLLDLMPLNANYTLDDCLLQNNLALCPSDVFGEEVEAELDAGGVPETPDTDTPEDDVDAEPDDTTPDDDDPDIDLDAPEGVDQGTIGLGESVEGTLASEEAHLWTFSDGPATIDIVLEGSDGLDAVLELYGSDNEFLESADSTFSDGIEELRSIEVDSGDYTIRIRDFFDEGGSYILTVTAEDESSSGGEDDDSDNSIFIFGDDDGEALSSGFTSVDTLADLLSADYDVTIWETSVDGPLQEDTLDGYSLIIWDSGDYRNEDGFLDEDTVLIFEKLDEGGKIIIMGSSPTLFSTLELVPLSDIEVAGEDAVLLDGFELGEVIELDTTYDVILFDDFAGDIEDSDVVLFVRGPGSENSGSVVGVATTDDGTNDTLAAFLLFPFTSLPGDVQETLLFNLLDWAGL
ncbi:MAG: hypothetical protein H6658_00640 [Ardenticatenaceae bacterium]|nr:hypothetical protein [Ardenticatenaceae bacterium]